MVQILYRHQVVKSRGMMTIELMSRMPIMLCPVPEMPMILWLALVLINELYMSLGLGNNGSFH